MDAENPYDVRKLALVTKLWMQFKMVTDKVSASVCRLMLIVLLVVGNSVEQGTVILAS